MGTQPEGMMLTGIYLAVLGLYVGLSAGFEAYEIEYKGEKLSMVPAWKGNKEWGGAQNKAQKERQVMPGVWRVESPMSSWEIADWVCRTQSNQKGRLIKINSKERYNELVKELYKLSTDWPYWTGLNDRQEEGKYKWQLCEDGKGEDLTAEMNLPFDDPDSHWEWMNPSKVNNPWGEEEDCSTWPTGGITPTSKPQTTGQSTPQIPPSNSVSTMPSAGRSGTTRGRTNLTGNMLCPCANWYVNVNA